MSRPDEIQESNPQAEREAVNELSIQLPAADGQIILSSPPEVVDNLRQLITRLSLESPFPGRLALTSALRGEGVTTQVQALATTLAHDGNATVGIVDLNWWWPSPQPFIPEENGGLAGVLENGLKLDQIIVPSGWSNLSFVPAGRMPASKRSKAARGPKLKEVLDSLSKRFDHLIFDVPAVLASSDTAPLLSLADGCCLVIRQGVTHTEDVSAALDTIQYYHVFGVILNQVKLATPNLLLKLFSQR